MDFIFGGNVFLENLFSFPQLRLATYSWSKMNNCINFFLYILTSPDFRKEFLQCVKVKHKDWIFAHFRTFCSESCVRWLSKLHEGKDSFSYVLVSIYIHARSHLFERLSPSFHWFVGQSVPLFQKNFIPPCHLIPKFVSQKFYFFIISTTVGSPSVRARVSFLYILIIPAIYVLHC